MLSGDGVWQVCLQAPAGGSKLLWPERARDTVSFRCSDLP